jgi:hypothetical protein
MENKAFKRQQSVVPLYPYHNELPACQGTCNEKIKAVLSFPTVLVLHNVHHPLKNSLSNIDTDGVGVHGLQSLDGFAGARGS